MAVQSLSKNFATFFTRLNPSTTFTDMAASQHNTIRGLIENANGPAAELTPKTFLQGSYRQQTAIYTINDVDIVVLCNLTYPGTPGLGGGKSYGRDEIFRIIAAPLLADGRYRNKVRYGPQSMCIKVDLEIKVEILPVVFKRATTDPTHEPFVLYRPHKGTWEGGYARHHQAWLSMKNSNERTDCNFVPAVKVFKHIRSRFNHSVASFHIECLLHFLQDYKFTGGAADYLASIFRSIAVHKPEDWYRTKVMTPCGDRDIFTGDEWTAEAWWKFHDLIVGCSKVADQAIAATSESEAIQGWQAILGDDFFPTRAL